MLIGLIWKSFILKIGLWNLTSRTKYETFLVIGSKNLPLVANRVESDKGSVKKSLIMYLYLGPALGLWSCLLIYTVTLLCLGPNWSITGFLFDFTFPDHHLMYLRPKGTSSGKTWIKIFCFQHMTQWKCISFDYPWIHNTGKKK